jgi:hypothetical protein
VCRDLFSMPAGKPLPQRLPDPCSGEVKPREPGEFYDPSVPVIPPAVFSSDPCPVITVGCAATEAVCPADSVLSEGEPVKVSLAAGAVYEQIYCEDIPDLTQPQREYLVGLGAVYQALGERDEAGVLVNGLDAFITVTSLHEPQAKALMELLDAAWIRVNEDAVALAERLLEGLCLWENEEQVAVCPPCSYGPEAQAYAASLGLLEDLNRTFNGEGVMQYVVAAGSETAASREEANSLALQSAYEKLGPCYLVNAADEVTCGEGEGAGSLTIAEGRFVEVLDPASEDPGAACAAALLSISDDMEALTDSFQENDCLPTGGVTVSCDNLENPVGENNVAFANPFEGYTNLPNTVLQVADPSGGLVIDSPEDTQDTGTSWKVTVAPGLFFGTDTDPEAAAQQARELALAFALSLLDCYYQSDLDQVCCPPLPAADSLGEEMWFFGDPDKSPDFSAALPAGLYTSPDTQLDADKQAWEQSFLQLDCLYCNMPVPPHCMPGCTDEEVGAVQSAIGASGAWKQMVDTLIAMGDPGTGDPAAWPEATYTADEGLVELIERRVGRAPKAGAVTNVRAVPGGGCFVDILNGDSTVSVVHVPLPLALTVELLVWINDGMPPNTAPDLAAGEALYTGDPSNVSNIQARLDEMCLIAPSVPSCQAERTGLEEDLSSSATPGADYGLICLETPDGVQVTAETVANIPFKQIDDIEECANKVCNYPVIIYCHRPEFMPGGPVEASGNDVPEGWQFGTIEGPTEDSPDYGFWFREGSRQVNGVNAMEVYLVNDYDASCIVENKEIIVEECRVVSTSAFAATQLAVQGAMGTLRCDFGNPPVKAACPCEGGEPLYLEANNCDPDTLAEYEDAKTRFPPVCPGAVVFTSPHTAKEAGVKEYTAFSKQYALVLAKKAVSGEIECLYGNEGVMLDDCGDLCLVKPGMVPAGMLPNGYSTSMATGMAQILAEQLLICEECPTDEQLTVVIIVNCRDNTGDDGGGGGGIITSDSDPDPGGGLSDSDIDSDSPGFYVGTGSLTVGTCDGPSYTVVWENGLVTSSVVGSVLACDCDSCGSDVDSGYAGSTYMALTSPTYALPPPDSVPNQVYVIKIPHCAGSPATVNVELPSDASPGDPGTTIDCNPSIDLNPGDSLAVWSDGTNWHIV